MTDDYFISEVKSEKMIYLNFSNGNDTVMDMDFGFDVKPISLWLELLVLLAGLLFLSIIGCIKAIGKIRALYREMIDSSNRSVNGSTNDESRLRIWLRCFDLENAHFEYPHVLPPLELEGPENLHVLPPLELQGPGIEAVLQGPGIEAVSQGPGIEAVSQGPGIEAVLQGPGIEAVLQGPVIEAVSQGPGIEVVLQGPGIEAEYGSG